MRPDQNRSAWPLPIADGSNRRFSGLSLNGPFAEREAAIGYYALGINELPNPQAIAGRAGSGGVVEGEWRGSSSAVAALMTGEVGGEDDGVPVAIGVLIHGEHPGVPLGEFQGRLEGLGQALFEPRLHPEAVHHDFYAVLALFVQAGAVVEIEHLAVDTGAYESSGGQGLEDRQVLSFRSSTTGASSMARVPSGKAMTWSTIWLTVCAARGAS